MQYVDNR